MVLADKDSTIAERLAIAGTAGCIGDLFSYPIDTVKVRLQIQGEKSAAGEKLKGSFGTLWAILRKEGFTSLYSGLQAGLQRQMCFSAIRLGLYDTVRELYSNALYDKNDKSMQIGARILGGITTGCLCVVVAQPTDVVKVRFQANVTEPGQKPRYKSTSAAFRQIFCDEGLRGMWKGTVPNMARTAIVNVSEIVCYDVAKDILLKQAKMKDDVKTHFTAAAISGFAATICASPMDVVKTRYMNAKKGEYSGPVNCAAQMVKKEGAKALYKGFFPSFSRLIIWNICMFISFEQLKIALRKLKPPPKPKSRWSL